MRVTHLGSHYAALRRVTGSLEAVGTSRDEVSSGKRIRRPSDDPTGMSRALQLRAALQLRDQESRNASDGEMWVNIADTNLQSAAEKLQRARELAVRGATFSSADERAGIAEEVAAIRSGLLDIANIRHQGRSVFGGFSSQDAIVNGGGAWSYGGDDGAVTRRIGQSEVVQVNVTADDVFGFTAGRDVFSVLDDFEAALRAGDTPAIDAAIDEIDTGLDGVMSSLTQLGAVGARIESANETILENIGEIQQQLSSLEDVDLTEAIMELQLNQQQYEAALAAFAQTSQASLVDFLR